MNYVTSTLSTGHTFLVSPDQAAGSEGIVQTSLGYLAALKSWAPDFKLQPGDICIDIGAHIGSFTVPLLLQYPGIICHCYEPDPLNFALLEKNLQYSGTPAHQYSLHRTAVFSQEGQVNFAKGMSSTTGSVWEVGVYKVRNENKRYFANNDKVKNEVVSHPATTLSTIFANHSITTCRLLKIDCEGSEYDILSSTPDEILNRVEFIIAELHPTDRRLPKWGLDHLTERGFKVRYEPYDNGCGMAYCKR